MLARIGKQLDALGHDQRREILQAVIDSPRCAPSALAETLGISLPLVSHHLKILADSSLVHAIPIAQYKAYMVNVVEMRNLGLALIAIADEQRTKGL